MRTVFRGGERASGNNRSAEQAKVFCGNMSALHLLRMVVTRDIRTRAAEVVGRNLLKNSTLLAPDVELRDVRPWKRSLCAGVSHLEQ